MILNLFLVSAVVMCASHTIAKERIFQPVRDALGNKDTFFGYLISCPYCVSHWISFGLVPITGIDNIFPIVSLPWILGPILRWFLTSLLVASIAAFLRVGFYLIDESQGLLRREEKLIDKHVGKIDK